MAITATQTTATTATATTSISRPRPRPRPRPAPPRSSLIYLFTTLLLTTLLSTSTADPYTHLSYPQIHYRLVRLSKQYPNLIRFYSAQDRFSLPHVGNCSQFPDDLIELSALIDDDSVAEPAPCTVWVVELSNFDTLPTDTSRPQWLVSGELHGDEVVGPISVLAFIEYMVSNYKIDSFARRMIDTRLSTLVPMTNAVGYFNNVRLEIQHPPNDSETSETEHILKLDPNRDFGYAQHPDKCMRTITARVINELYRVHLFRVAVTFHGGTNALGYEWGDMTHCDNQNCGPAPDTYIMRALALRMSDNAGPAGQYEEAYPVGNMARLVYPVPGGMEDWGYGASWTASAVVCTPSTLGGYPSSKTAIDRKTKRAITYLVETSKDKRPPEQMLGGSGELTRRGSSNDGHVPRNVRLLFSVIDAVHPYVILNDVSIDQSNGLVKGSWIVGGAFEVDATVLIWSLKNGSKHGIMPVQNGTAGLPIAGGSGTVFSQEVSEDGKPTHDSDLYFRVAAIVDQAYTKKPSGSLPDISPQSHLIGSRSSYSWTFSVDGREIKGERIFFSETMSVAISTDGQSFTQSISKDVHWGHDSNNNGNVDDDIVKLYSPKEDDLLKSLLYHIGLDIDSELLPSASLSDGKHIILIAGIVSVICIVAIAIIIYLLIRYRRSRREKGYTKSYIHHPSKFSSVQEDDERIALASENISNNSAV